jgi:hypothetical protein
VVLPDGSRSLIPADWTDWSGTAEQPSPEHRDSCLASLADLLHARRIADALTGRCLIPQPAADEESCDAADPGLSRPPTQSPPNRQLGDAEARAEALSVLARIIAQACQTTDQTEATDE